ncbi:putative chloramphenical resistance permease RarD [Hartmannibacter diazotrophicus]|uniref:Putative chloramphenical resistance permease RarD n=1 Tax=Hartmannibacter diazotrophicus TaxID=1482074 RepID=A0A2C9D994_9HYPH|nr:EamA family transporter RarD [Hartmannibacter diazotrophicus]SON56904.1 putative chloramphenical resistance permease RarD [Hartmannibacter diazotrophicus]
MALDSSQPAPALKNEDTLAGFGYAFTAYVLWGFLPLYMKAVAHIPSSEVVAHRILWSVPIAGFVLAFRGRVGDVWIALKTPRMLGMAALTASLISVNWLIYVWSIAAGRALESALGYYINPLFSVALGAIVLKERLTPIQLAAIGLAVVAVAVLAVGAGGLPWVSLALAFSWGCYALLRKTLPVGPNQGFFLEVLLLSPVALGYLAYLYTSGEGHFGFTGMPDMLLLMASGLVTAVPLMIYANGAKLLKLSTIGIMQYIAPTMIFLIAVFVFHEPFGPEKLVAFGFIWAALALYSFSMLRGR